MQIEVHPVAYADVEPLRQLYRHECTCQIVHDSFLACGLAVFRESLSASGATHIEAQSNIPLMALMLYDFAVNVKAENILFSDAFVTHLACSHGTFRQAAPKDGSVLASGGFDPP